MKHRIILLTIFLISASLHSNGQIELDWANDIVAKGTLEISDDDLSDGTISVNSIPAGTDKTKLVLKIKGNNVSQSAIAAATNQALYDNLKTTLTPLIAAGPVVLEFTFDGNPLGTVTLKKKSGPAATTAKASSKDFSNAVKKKYGGKISSGTIRFDRRLNQAHEKNIIHVFLDELGNFHFSGLPTTAREDNIFVFHVFYEEKENVNYRLEYEGEFDPSFEVFGAKKQPDDMPVINATGQKETIKIGETEFAPIGPFTGSFKVQITKTGSNIVLLEKTVKVAKLHHITLTAGLYGTFLRNPDNIAIFERPGGDSTLVADDPTSRGFVTVMLTFYPKPRNILFPSTDWKERIGFSVGTSISKKLAENFFAGVSYDIARGLSLTAGVHYGRVNYVIDYPDFKFGEDKFTGSLENRVKKRWDLGFYTGINMDFRLLTYIFNPQQ